MEPKRVLIIVGMIIAAGILFMQVRKMGAPAETAAPVAAEVIDQVEYSKVLVAAGEIPFGHRFTEEDLLWKDWPSEALSPEYITQDAAPDALTEYTGAVSRSVVYLNEPITPKKIVLPGTQGMMAAILSPGMRAVAARVSAETTAGGFIQPGDYVDIIMTSTENQIDRDSGMASGKSISIAATIFENVKVLAIDQIYSSDPEANGAAILGSTATFEMTQGDAELLRLSVEEADELTLTLRPISDGAGVPGVSSARIKAKENARGGRGSVSIYRHGVQQQVAVKGSTR